jgi:transposase-like protein
MTSVCRKLGITEASYYRWRQQYDPAKVDDGRRVHQREAEVERLKLLVAEILLDKRMLQDVARHTTHLPNGRNQGLMETDHHGHVWLPWPGKPTRPTC